MRLTSIIERVAVAAGFREHEHTADWQLQVWAADLESLFEQAALGMYALAGVRLAAQPRVERTLVLQASDAESLLVAFLSELLYLGEAEALGFDRFALRLEDAQLDARMHGAAIASQEKEIKAVTYHNLEIAQGERGLEVQIVFDV